MLRQHVGQVGLNCMIWFELHQLRDCCDTVELGRVKINKKWGVGSCGLSMMHGRNPVRAFELTKMSRGMGENMWVAALE